jgi:hypothetical protein
MNTFKKHNGEWVVAVLAADHAPGQVVSVDLRNGGSKRVTLGARIIANLYAVAPTPRAAAAAPVAVASAGDLSRVVAMFDRARQHLRRPAIVLDGFRVSVAGARAAQPGSLTITSVDRTEPPRENSRFGGMERKWFGRVSTAGEFQPGRDAPVDLADKLRRFAADPAGVAAEYGRLHGACCFCSRALSDERSTAVGYGPICADHYGLPWGEREVAEGRARQHGERPEAPEAYRHVQMDAPDLITMIADAERAAIAAGVYTAWLNAFTRNREQHGIREALRLSAINHGIEADARTPGSVDYDLPREERAEGHDLFDRHPDSMECVVA